MDVQADAALEAMAEIAAGAEGATGPSSLPIASSSSSPSKKSSSPSTPSPHDSLSLPPGAAGGSGSADVPEKGYPKAISESPIEEKFLCGYCQNILRVPQQSECGHRFCKCCLTKMKQLPQPVICQACVQEEMPEDCCKLDLEAMFDDKAAIREMRKIPVKCIITGCTWKGIFHEYIMRHENSCDKKMVACNMCGKVMSQNSLAKHQTNQCPKRPVSCQFCQQQMMHEQLEKHQITQCPFVPVKCEKCSTTVPKNEFKIHLERDCVHRDVTCPAPDCNKKMPKEQFSSHLNESPKLVQKHMLFLFDKIHELEQELARLQIQLRPVPGHSDQQGMAASAEGAGARDKPDVVDHPQREQHRAHEAVGGAEGGAVSEPQASATLKLHEDLMSVLHGEILRCIRQVEAIMAGRTRETAAMRDLQGKMDNLERSLGTMEMRLQELQAPTPFVGNLAECGDGVATWCIPQFSQIRRAAVNGGQTFIDSPPFMTGSYGYKMKMRLFPDGDNAAKGNALSVYLHLLPGPCDDLLPWPFQADIHFVLIDQKEFKQHKSGSIRAPASEQSTKRPVPDVQLGFGLETLVTLQEMGTDLSRYNVRDNLYLRIIVDLRRSTMAGRLKSLDPRANHVNYRRADGAGKKN